MQKSMALLKREHENKYAELKALMNELKAQIVRRDITNFCNGRYEEHPLYGVEVSAGVYARVDDATGGYKCLSIEDRRKEAFLWIFDIEFDTEFYQAEHVFESEPSPDNLIYVRDIESEDDSMKRSVQAAIDKLSKSVEVVKSFNFETVGYAYSYAEPEPKKINGFENVIQYILGFER